MSPELAQLAADLIGEGEPALAEELMSLGHDAHRYIACRWKQAQMMREDETLYYPEYDEAADKIVHQYEESKN